MGSQIASIIHQEITGFVRPQPLSLTPEQRDSRSIFGLHLIAQSDNPEIEHQGEKIHVREYCYRYLDSSHHQALLRSLGVKLPLDPTDTTIVTWYCMTYGLPKVSPSSMSMIQEHKHLYSVSKALFNLDNKTKPALLVAILYGANIQEISCVKLSGEDAWLIAYAVIGHQMRERTESPYYCVENIKRELRLSLTEMVRLKDLDQLKNYIYSHGWINPWELGCTTTPHCTYLHLLRYIGGRLAVDQQPDSQLIGDWSEDDRESFFSLVRAEVDKTQSQDHPEWFGFRVMAYVKEMLEDSSDQED